MYIQKKYKNNLRLITAPMEGTRTFTVLVMIATGSKYENRDNSGISHFLEHMFFKGTEKRPSTLGISSELDSVGAEFNAFTSKEYTGYWVKVSSDKKEMAVDIISDMLINSKFESEEINREKGVIIEELNMYEDNPMMHIEDVFEQCLYGDTPAGWDVIGTKDNINNFERKDFIDYFKTQYVAENTVVCFAGDVSINESEVFVDKYFSKMNNAKSIDKKATSDLQDSPKVKINNKKTDQVNLSLGVRTVPSNHKDEIILKFVANILGGSMSSRLFTQLRERNGLAYYVRTGTEFYTDTGYLTTQAGVPISKIDQSIDIILKEYRKIKTESIDEVELKKVKDMIKGRAILQMESSDNIANWYAKQAVLDKKILQLSDFIKIIDNITANDVQRVSDYIFNNNRLNLAMIGDFNNESLKNFQANLKL